MLKDKKKKKKRGRPIELTPEVQKKIILALSGGNYIHTACQWAGIGLRTFYDWLEWGEKKKAPEFIAFSQAVENAQAEAEMKLISSIEKQANGRKAKYQDGKLIEAEISSDWRAGAWILERKFPDRWGKRDQVKLYEAEKGEDFRPDGSYEKMLDIIHEIEEQAEKDES